MFERTEARTSHLGGHTEPLVVRQLLGRRVDESGQPDRGQPHLEATVIPHARMFGHPDPHIKRLEIAVLPLAVGCWP
jgi:hypothetical protein